MDENMKDGILSLSKSEQTRFLALFAHWFTVAARANYDVEPEKALPRMKAINEMLHITLGKLIELTTIGHEPFPMADLLVSLEFRADEQARYDLDWALSGAFNRVTRS